MGVARYFPANRAFVIAEIGTSHRGDHLRARKLVDAAADAGADCVKTQIVYAEEIVHPAAGTIELPGGAVAVFDRFTELELPLEFFAETAQHCERRGMAFLASCFGRRGLADLTELGLDVVKIASPEINHASLLRGVRDASLGAILSTGVSTLCDIERALELTGREATGLLHCVTSYPAPEEDYNLRVITHLSRMFGVPVGVSDHSADPVLVPSASVALGARAVEKHLTLSRAGEGLDDAIALEPEGFARMVSAVRRASSRSTEETLNELSTSYGDERLEAVLGDGVKRLAASEACNYGRSNRSILATADIAAGETIGEHNAAALRSEQNVTPGLSPFDWEHVRGARAARSIPNGTGILWTHLLSS
ncbi:MAG: N-acetylneuraminate synthase family protein [Spirochaetota bacterium]